MTSPVANIAMKAAWDGEEGDDWTANAERYEASTQRVWSRLDLDGLIEADDRVLDIGCGTGKSTRAAARVASSGFAVGIDLSSRMLAYARDRARAEGVPNVEFIQGDAQVYPFKPNAFDVAVSLFGAMFFNDPAAAFANVHAALTGGAQVALFAWRSLEDNEWLSVIRNALSAGRTLPSPPVSAPGPFGLADPGTVQTILTRVGFVDVNLAPVNEPIRLGADAEDAWTFVTGMGVVRGLTQDLDDGTTAAALDRLRDVLGGYETSDGVLLESGAWLITAQCA